MNPIISLSKSGKMSASDPNGKIALTDSDISIRDKIKKAFCADGDSNCGLMTLMRCVFFALQPSVTIHTDLEPRTYLTYPLFEDDFRANIFTAIHLKQTITTLIIDLLTPIRDYIQSPPMQAIVTAAYPA